MFLALIIVSVSVLYLFIGGVCGVKFLQWRLAECSRCREGLRCVRDHEVCAAFNGIFFPFVLPVVLGMGAAGVRESREEKEIRKAEHRRELAKIRAEETKYLEQALER